MFERLVKDDGPLWKGRRPRSVPLIRVLSLAEALRVRPVARGVVVSIRAPGEEPALQSSGWRAMLSLEIPDVDAYGNLEPGVDLGPAAEAIAEFVRRHRGAPMIVLQCRAGLSRSRSIAAALCEAFGWRQYRWTVFHHALHVAVLTALRGAEAREAEVAAS